MSELDLISEEIINAISQHQTTGYIYVAGLALVAYDTLLSFSQEITYIWKRKKSMITILYLFIRYSIIFNMFIRVFHLSNMHITIAR
ncbi:hypothetical protein QCA50_020459 [Cerrena zonata]|uniref:DUF6533 domain-containing protein n=1 Tax=Cerrena zonata TaxID=2478898 RepID=A0AAW0F834_9APHY